MDQPRTPTPLHVETPLWHSPPLAAALGEGADADARPEVFLKMEALQPVGSFKIRGIGRVCQHHVTAGARSLLSSSGGNAGYAVAFAGRQLGVPVEVIVPATTPSLMRERIRHQGGTVTEHGSCWDDAHAHALELARNRPAAAFIHPFDDPRLWDGHATLIEEVAAKLAGPPDAVVVSVGGGGLLIGVLQGLHSVGWQEVPVLAVETEGAASLARSVAAGRLVTLPRIDSLATSLGARTVAATALAWCGRHDVRPLVVSDRTAVSACARFADDHRLLVEPACGASLGVVYERSAALLELCGSNVDRRSRTPQVVVICCGGAGVSLQLLAAWRAAAG